MDRFRRAIFRHISSRSRMFRYKFYVVTVLLVLLVWQLFLNQSVKLDVRYVEKNLGALDQTDPQLIEYVRARHLISPSKLPYTLAKGQGYHNDSTIGWVQNFFRDKKDGTFIEVGAHNGVRETHTLYLEREQGWTGLLIECNPTLVTSLRSLHRNAWIAQACLSFTPHAGILNFTLPTNGEWSVIGTLKRTPAREKLNGAPKEWMSFDVEAVPLYTLLAAWGKKDIDYFNFDIEGGELPVLKTFPFDQFIFKVFIIETIYYNETEKKELDLLVKTKGYHFVKSEGRDFIYVHNSVKHLLH